MKFFKSKITSQSLPPPCGDYLGILLKKTSDFVSITRRGENASMKGKKGSILQEGHLVFGREEDDAVQPGLFPDINLAEEAESAASVEAGLEKN